MTTEQRSFDEEPRLTDRTEQEAEEATETEDKTTEDEMAKELAVQEAGSAAAVPEPQPGESETAENMADDLPSEGEALGADAPSDSAASGSLFSTFGVIPPTYASRTQLRSGIEEANWFNQFRERLAQSYSTPHGGEVKTFGMAEAVEVPLRQPIAADNDAEADAGADIAAVTGTTGATDTGTTDDASMTRTEAAHTDTTHDETADAGTAEITAVADQTDNDDAEQT